MQDILLRHQITPKSFVFPKNQIEYLDYLSTSSIEIYRAPDHYWYSKFPGVLKKIMRQFDYILPICPKVFDIERDNHGLYYTRGSLLFKKNHFGLKKHIPMRTYQIKAKKGIDRAIREKRTFHLWFHPFNFAYDEESHFNSLENVLIYAREAESQGKLRICTMKDLIPNI